MKKKIYSYIGFARKSGNLMTGYNTCTLTTEKGKMKLLILTEDIAENSKKKMIKTAKKHNVPYRIYGKAEELSHAAGRTGAGIFGITDRNFADVILKEIDQGQQEEKEVF